MKQENGFPKTKILPLPIITIIISSTGFIGYWVVYISIQKLQKSISLGNFTEDADTLIHKFRNYSITMSCFSSLIFIGIIIILISLYRKKSLFSLVIGLILCAYIIASPYIQMLIHR
jgi:uncharacterized membrane protein (UPF0136 family)